MLKIWFFLNFQDYNSLVMLMLSEFNDFSMMILLIIVIYILYLFFWFFINNYIDYSILHNHLLEVIWTLMPVMVLIFMAFPSLNILYLTEDFFNPYLTLKVMGHQWYWSYEYSDFLNIDFDSFMISKIISEKIFRLFDVDNRVILPYNVMIRGLISSFDVIHSWAMPTLGVKIDAIPGRINQIMFLLNRMGIYFGQCSEICGLNHSFMPIVLESLNMKYFLYWMKNM